MKASEFEFRHQTFLHLLLVTFAFLTYLLQPDDVVWALVKDFPHNRLLERSLFAVATLLMGVAAGISTWARAYPGSDLAAVSAPATAGGPYRYLRYPQQLGDFLFSVGLGSLAPLSGFLILVAGQALLVFRLIRRANSLALAATSPQPLQQPSDPAPSSCPAHPANGLANHGVQAFRQESAKWGLFLTMIVFTALLVDRLAEILALASLLLWLLLNLPHFNYSPKH